MHHFVTEWCIVGYLPGILCDFVRLVYCFFGCDAPNPLPDILYTWPQKIPLNWSICPTCDSRLLCVIVLDRPQNWPHLKCAFLRNLKTNAADKMCILTWTNTHPQQNAIKALMSNSVGLQSMRNTWGTTMVQLLKFRNGWEIHPTFYRACANLSMLGLMLNHVNKRDSWSVRMNRKLPHADTGIIGVSNHV